MRNPRNIRFLLLTAALTLAVGCGGDDDPGGDGPGLGAVPDFRLVDVNPNSVTFDHPVSPREYIGEVSAWYFGHST